MITRMIKNPVKFFSRKYIFVEPSISYIFEQTMEERGEARLKRQKIYNENKNFWNIYDDTVFEVSMFFRNKIRSPFYSIIDGLGNFWKYRKVVWNDRWWDHAFLTYWIGAKIQDMHDNWDDSHYIGSEKEKEVLEKLLGYLEIMSNYEFEEASQEQAKKEFFKLLSAHYEKFWD